MLRPAVLGALLIITATACSSAGGTITAPETGSAVTSITVVPPAEAASIIDGKMGEPGFVVLDVRTADEYSGGHIGGAVNLDFYSPDFADQIASLDRTDEYVVYCRSGNRSGKTADLMRQLGFTNVTDIAGGIGAWQAAGLPVTSAG